MRSCRAATSQRGATKASHCSTLATTSGDAPSAYLSAANRVANTARGKATDEIKRQSKRQTSMVNAGVDAWTPKPQAKAQPARKRRLGYFSAATNRLDSQPRGLPGLVRLFRMLRRKTSYPRFQRLDRSAYRDAQPGYLIDYYHPV